MNKRPVAMAPTSPPRPSPSSRFTAAALTLLMIASAVPLVMADHDGDNLPDVPATPTVSPPVGTNPVEQAGGFWVVQGEARLYQGNWHSGREPTYFIDNGTGTVNITVPIHNNRASQVNSPVVVWMWLSDAWAPKRATCFQLASINRTDPTSIDRIDYAYWPDLVTRDLEHRFYNVSYVVNLGGRPSSAENFPDDVHCPNHATADTSDNIDGNRHVEATDTDNRGRLYFVKEKFLDLTVAKRQDPELGEVPDVIWCKETATGTCDGAMDNGAWNKTVVGTTRPTFFLVKTENHGTWEDLTNHNCINPVGTAKLAPTCQPTWQYDLNITLRGALTTVDNTSNAHAKSGADGRSGVWDINERAGVYTARIDIDPRGLLRQGDDTKSDVTITNLAFPSSAENARARPIEVKWRDYTANISASDFRTSAASPYVYSESFRILGNITISNLGKLATNATTNSDTCCPVYYRYYLDNTTQNVFNSAGNGHEDERFNLFDTACPADGSTPCSSRLITIDWEASSVLTNPRYLPPGKHTIIVEVDNTTQTNPGALEIDEKNNRVELDIFVQDVTKPRFLDGPKITLDRLGSLLQQRPAETMRAGENFTIHVNLTDDDLANLNVTANFTYNNTTWRTYTLAQVGGGIGNIERYLLTNISNFTFATDTAEENWTLNISARDSFGNMENSTSTRVRLLRWPLQTINASQIFIDPVNDPQEYQLTDPRITSGLNFTILVTNDTTGFYGNPDVPATQQPNHTANLALNYTTPKGVTKAKGPEFWTPNTVCREVPVPVQEQVQGQTSTTSCNDAVTIAEGPYSSFGSTKVIVNDDEGGPGTWNFSIIIKDVSGQERVFNRTIRVLDAAPTILEKSVFPSELRPGQPFNVTVNATDDVEVKAAYVNFTRSAPADGTYVNLTLFNASTHPIPGQSGLWYWWNSTFETGRHKAFGIGGTFGVNISVKDGTDNWRTESVGTFTVSDTEPPQVDEASVSPAVQEVGNNVTFTVRARDATNVTAYLRILQGSLVVFPTNATFDNPGVEMIEDASGNFSYSLNLSTEGEYTWIIDVVDSVGRSPGSRTGSLSFRDNLGPRFELRSPSYVFEGQRYSGPTPRIEALVYDSEGVQATSVTARVDDRPVSVDLLPAPAGANGFLVVYNVPASNRYQHGDVVTVNLTAMDNSSRQLGGFGNFSFVVDDVAPIARLVSVDPSYRARPTDPLNISLSTRFTLAAEDNDGLPTVADAITVQVLGGGNNGEIVYTGPFKINDPPGLYTGPRVYSVQFWATDSVGNRNATKNITTVFVDETPPALFQYLPQGRFINATFVDDRVGVSRAVVWYRLNNEPHTPISLTQDGDQWTTTLPEGKKGDRVAYYLQAWDRLNNTATYGNATLPYASFEVGNHEPQIQIVSPADGSRVSRQLDLRWNASDADGDALVFTVSYKQPGATTYRELTKLENRLASRFTIDTTKYPDGEYTFRVAVSDGGFSRVDEITLTIINQASPVGPVTAPKEATPGDRVLIKAQITKAQAVVEARLYLEGDLLQAYPMNDEGRDGDEVANDGYYSVRVPVDAAGDYRVEIFTRYQEDGEMKESSVVDAASFSAKLTPGYVLSEYMALIVGIGLLAAVGIGVAVYVVVRRK